ncbi:MAG: type I methionyl aminopeptidase [Candidatus Omnitrophota bacterium]
MIPLKSEEDLKVLREAGKILSGIMKRLREKVKPGISTRELDLLAEELILENEVLPAFKNYKGYPATLCASVNNEIVHGIPDERCLLEGDIISLDLGIISRGYYSDAAITVGVGEINPKIQKFIEVAKKSLAEGIKEAQAGNQLFDISHAIQSYAEKHGFSVVRQFVGHGIGKQLHEDPEIPNFGAAHQGPLLKEGMVLAIEPMINMGGWESEILDNGWTAVTKDGSLSAHFEHTVAITKEGVEILTV